MLYLDYMPDALLPASKPSSGRSTPASHMSDDGASTTNGTSAAGDVGSSTSGRRPQVEEDAVDVQLGGMDGKIDRPRDKNLWVVLWVFYPRSLGGTIEVGRALFALPPE